MATPLTVGVTKSTVAAHTYGPAILNTLSSPRIAAIAAALPFATTANLAIALLALVATIFIFAVTLLGNAVDRAREEETQAEIEGKKDFDLKINDLENKIKAAKASGDTSQIEAQLEDLNRARAKGDAVLVGIQNKYAALSLKNGFLVPSAMFFIAIVLNEAASHLRAFNSIIVWLMAIMAISAGAYKIYLCLHLAEEISAASDEYQNRKLADAFQTALANFERQNQEALELMSLQPDFPLTVAPGLELTITFRLNLTRGKHISAACVWFFVPDSFELINPAEKTAWRQGTDFVVPNIRTVKVVVGDIDKGSYSPGLLKLKAPATTGDYNLFYAVKGKGYSDGRVTLSIKVA